MLPLQDISLDCFRIDCIRVYCVIVCVESAGAEHGFIVVQIFTQLNTQRTIDLTHVDLCVAV